jgi:hypothetical protein
MYMGGGFRAWNGNSALLSGPEPAGTGGPTMGGIDDEADVPATRH